ncbi:hypothetical protein BY996DRAFT_6885123, partial [Phakopsora pachyrhizi]
MEPSSVSTFNNYHEQDRQRYVPSRRSITATTGPTAEIFHLDDESSSDVSYDSSMRDGAGEINLTHNPRDLTPISPPYRSRSGTVSLTNSNQLPPEYLSGSWQGNVYNDYSNLNHNQTNNPSNGTVNTNVIINSSNHHLILSNLPQLHSENNHSRRSIEIEVLSQNVQTDDLTSQLGYNPKDFLSDLSIKTKSSINHLDKDQRFKTEEMNTRGGRFTEQDLLRFRRSPSNVDYSSETDGGGQSFDDYDWENDDDLDGDARFEDLNADKAEYNHHQRRALTRRFSPYNIFKVLLTTFIGNIILSIVFIIPPLILRFDGYYEATNNPQALYHHLHYDNTSAWLFWISYNLMSSWALHFLTELSPRIAVSLVSIIWGDVSESIKTQIETFHTYKTWLKVLLYSAMGWGSWEVIFGGIFDLHSTTTKPSRAHYTDTIHIIAQLIFFLMLVLCIEKLLLMSISMSFHRVAYSDRIQRVTKALAAIDTLQDYRPKRKSNPMAFQTRHSSGEIMTLRGLSSAITSPQRKHELPKRGPTEQNGGSAGKPNRKWWQRKQKKLSDTIDPEKGVNDPEPSAEESREKIDFDEPSAENSSSRQHTSYHQSLGNYPNQSEADEKTRIRRKNSQTTFELMAKRGASAAKIARSAMKDPVAVVGKKSGLGLDINNPTEARKLARRIYFSFKTDPSRHYLITSDFYPAFPTRELAESAFSIFDSDGNGDISRTEIKNEIFRVYKERRALAQSLQDVSHAIGKLDGIMMALGAVIFVFIALSVTGIDFAKTLTSVYTVGIAAAFIFKETAGNVFDSIIMVFCTHPYDTGDRIIMDNAGVEEVLTVKRMGLLATVFVRWDGTEWFAPNALLGQKFIINLRRSSNQFENVTLQFGWNTPL